MTLPFIISLPHCASEIPQEYQNDLALSGLAVWRSVDQGTKEVFGSLPVVETIKAEWIRLLVDLNRDPQNRKPKGVIAIQDCMGKDIFLPGKYPDPNQIEERLIKYHKPYHDRLSCALNKYDFKVLFDCHSLYGIGPDDAPDAGKQRSDITLGNNGQKMGYKDPERGEVTCPPKTLAFMGKCFEEQGFSVSLNDPYAGGYITRHYGTRIAEQGKMAVQIEINKSHFISPKGPELIGKKVEVFRIRVEKALFAIACGI